MVDSLSKELNATSTVAISDTPELDSKSYKNIRIIGIKYPWDGNRRFVSFFKTFYLIKYWMYVFSKKFFKNININFFLKQDTVDVINEIYDSDIVISCGGGYINSLGKLQIRLSYILTGIAFNKPTIFYSQSVSDLFGPFDKFIVKFTINKSDMFIAREKLTYNYLINIGVMSSKLSLQADSAFLLQMKEPSQLDDKLRDILSRNNTVGITVTRWNFPGLSNAAKLKDNYISCFRKFASYLVNDCNFNVIVFPQVTGPNDFSDDRLFAKEIFAPLNNNGITVLEGKYSPENLKMLISKAKYFVGTRMHSNIFAIGAKVPTIAIAYQDKTVGIMEMIGMEDLVIHINNITENNLIDKFNKLVSSREEVAKKLDIVVAEAAKSANYAAVICKNVYNANSI
jgi:colanic acid/amylovoran biosynthesis protein